MINIPKEDIEALSVWEQEFIKRGEIKLRRKSVPVRIKLRSTGEFITTASGKTIWPSLGAAKNALRNDFGQHRIFSWAYNRPNNNLPYIHTVSKQYAAYDEQHQRQENAYQYFIENFVDFIPCP